MRIRKLFAITFCIVFILAGCSDPQFPKNPENYTSKRKTSFDHFGTACFAVVFDNFTSPAADKRFESAWREIYLMLGELESRLSMDYVGSDIYKFNEAGYEEKVAISPVTADMVKLAIEMYEITGGAYNPAVANLVDLWGFSPRFRNKDAKAKAMPYDRLRNEDGSFDLPDKRYIEAFKALSDFSKVILSGNKTDGYFLTKNVKDVEVDGVSYSLKIDLGGLAKGYGADKAAEILKKKGYEYGYINLGLSSMHLLKRNVSNKGAPEDNMWAIHKSNPNNPAHDYLVTYGKDIGVSTSGTYEVNYDINGREYSHIIDGDTGEPTVSSIASVTVIGAESSYADAISTAMCVMDKEEAIEFMNTRLKDYRVACVVRKGDNFELITNMADGEYVLNK